MDLDNVYYVGLRKIEWLLSLKGSELTRRDVTKTFDVGAQLSATPSLSSNATVAVSSGEYSASTPHEALRHLPVVAKSVAANARGFADPQLEVDDWIWFDGVGAFGVMARDSYGEGDRPWCAYWRIPTRVLHTGSGRWLILTGTPDGNLRDRWTGNFPGNRSGSSTESFFDLVHAIANEKPHKDRVDVKWYVGKAADIAGMPDVPQIRSCGLAQVKRIIHAPESNYELDYREADSPMVTELVIATPLYAERVPPPRPDPEPIPEGMLDSGRSSVKRRWWQRGRR